MTKIFYSGGQTKNEVKYVQTSSGSFIIVDRYQNFVLPEVLKDFSVQSVEFQNHRFANISIGKFILMAFIGKVTLCKISETRNLMKDCLQGI